MFYFIWNALGTKIFYFHLRNTSTTTSLGSESDGTNAGIRGFISTQPRQLLQKIFKSILRNSAVLPIQLREVILDIHKQFYAVWYSYCIASEGCDYSEYHPIAAGVEGTGNLGKTPKQTQKGPKGHLIWHNNLYILSMRLYRNRAKLRVFRTCWCCWSHTAEYTGGDIGKNVGTFTFTSWLFKTIFPSNDYRVGVPNMNPEIGWVFWCLVD